MCGHVSLRVGTLKDAICRNFASVFLHFVPSLLTVERCMLICISYQQDVDSHHAIVSEIQWVFCICDGGLPKEIVWFQFSEFGLLVETECSSMANAKSVPGGWGARH